MDTYSTMKQPSGVTALPNEARVSAVSWAAVIAGAFVAAALSVTLVALGMGLGLSAVSPWSNAGASATTLGVATIIWLILMQVISSGMGGYIAGRLRTKWVDVHTDEVFFRDTAHGFLAWAVGVVIGAAFLASAAASLIGAATETAVPPLTAAAGAAGARAPDAARSATGNSEGRYGYYVDTLMRPSQGGGGTPAARGGASDAASTPAEIGRIFANGMQRRTLAGGDRTYLAGMIAARTGVSQTDAEQRVEEGMGQGKRGDAEAKRVADTARKGAAHLALWTFVCFPIGAFCPTYGATIGGR